mgnify:CR=1 FL=1
MTKENLNGEYSVSTSANENETKTISLSKVEYCSLISALKYEICNNEEGSSSYKEYLVGLRDKLKSIWKE